MRRKPFALRLLSLLLVAVMTFGLLPNYSFAAEMESDDSVLTEPAADESVATDASQTPEADPQEVADTDVAKIGDIGYATLADAVAAAVDGDTVYLLADMELSTAVAVKTDITITAESAVTLTRTSYNDIFDVNTDATLTLSGPITLVGNTQYGTMVDVLKSGTFIMNEGVVIRDNQTGKTGYAGGVTVTDGTFVMNGGTIDNCSNTDSTKPGSSNGGTLGGAVRVISTSTSTVDASFTMNGGTISNSTAYNGGAVGLENKANSKGATTTFTMNGGTITGCSQTNDSSPYCGGAAVYVYNKLYSGTVGAFVNINGGKITNNTGEKCGVLCIYTGLTGNTYGGKINIMGGEISGNFVGSGTNNAPSSFYGNGIYLDRLINSEPLLTVGGTAVIEDEIYLKSSTGNYFEILDGFTGSVNVFSQAGGVGTTPVYGTLVAKQVAADGSASTATDAVAGKVTALYNNLNDNNERYEHPVYDVVVGTNADEYVLGEHVSVVEYTVTYTDGVEDAEVFADQTYTVEEGAATPAFDGTPAREGYTFTGWTPEVAETVTADAVYTAQWEQAVVYVAQLESTGEQYETLQAAIDAAKALMVDAEHEEQTITLLNNTTENVSVSYSSLSTACNFLLTIDLNGYTVTGAGNGSVMTFSRLGSSGTTYRMVVTINDSSAAKTGTITGGNGSFGGAIKMDGTKFGINDSLIINGGNFVNNTATTNGGAIYAATANMDIVINDGYFSGNTAKTGGAISALDITVNGGVITGNTANGDATFTGRGGGIQVWSTGKVLLTVTGGQIYGNTASRYGDDIVFCSTNNASATMSLIPAADMKVEGVNGWFVDGYYGAQSSEANLTARHDAANPVAFDDYASFSGSGIAVALKAAFAEATVEYTVTYTDGVEDAEVFADQVYTVAEGEATPAFDGTPAREGYTFTGWTPEVAETVTADAVYTAQWEKAVVYVAQLESTGEQYETLQAAIDAAVALMVDDAGAVQTVTILTDIQESVSIAWTANSGSPATPTLNIDLNGKTVTGNGGSVFTIGRYGSYTMKFNVVFKDSVGTGVVTGGTGTVSGSNTYGGAIYAKDGSSYITIEGGTWTGNTATNGGVVAAAYSNNTNYVTVNGGTITGNTATGNGGAIYGRYVFINGGTITGNTAASGGGVYVFIAAATKLEMTGGAVYGNTATTDGDDIIWRANKGNSSTAYMKLIDAADMGNGITGWYKDDDGSRFSETNAIEFTDYAKFTTLNTRIALKAAAYTPVVMYTVTYTDGVEDAEVFADQVYTVAEGEATPVFEGTPTREGYTFTGWTPEVAETVTADAVYTAQWEKAVVYVAQLESTGEQYETLQAAIDAANALLKEGGSTAETVTLLADTTECVSVTWAAAAVSTVTIDLNGHTVTGDGTSAVFYFVKGSTAKNISIVINDSVGTAKVTGGVGYTHSGTVKGGAIFVNSSLGGTLTINGGTFCDNTATVGGAIHSVGTNVIINGGTFTGNSAKNGGAIYAQNLTVNGGEITGNTAYGEVTETSTGVTTAGGGGIAVRGSEVHLTINGGKIYGNTAVGWADDILFINTSSRTTSDMSLMAASTMGAEFDGWYVDGLNGTYKKGRTDRFGAGTIVEYTGLTLDGTGAKQLELGLKASSTYAVTYTDGVEEEEVFADQVILAVPGSATPAFEGTPNRDGYTFEGWNPEVAETVTADATYTATWAALPALPTESYLETMSRGYVVYVIENYNVNADGTSGTPKVSPSEPRAFSFNALPGTYELSKVTVGEDGAYYCTLTITDVDTYLMGFQEEYETSSEKYALDTANNTTITATLKWNGSKWLYDETDFNANQGKYLYVVHTKHTSKDGWTVVTEATCTENGLQTKQCSHLAGGGQNSTRCAYVISEVIPALGHDYVDGVCTRCGEKDPDYVAPPALPTESYLETMSRGYVVYVIENYNVNADGTSGTPKVSPSEPRAVSFNALPGTYELSEVTVGEDGAFYCTLTITDVDTYLMWFQEEYETSSEKYALDTSNNTTITATLKWNGSKWLYEETDFNANQGKYLYVVHTKHTSKDTWIVVTEPTCTEDGLQTRQCSHLAGGGQNSTRCAYVISEVIPALGHDYVDGVCTRCGEKDPDYVAPPALPTESYLETMSRGYVVYVIENYNVNADGTSGTPKVTNTFPRAVSFNAEPGTYELSEVYMGEDGAYYVDLTITDLDYYLDWYLEEYDNYVLDTANNSTVSVTMKWNGSRWLYEETADFNANRGVYVYVVHSKHSSKDAWTVVTEATCTEDGLRTKRCDHMAGAQQDSTRCNRIIEEVIPATGHTAGDEWITDGENHWHVCENCGEKIDNAAHKWNSGEFTKVPTLTEGGEMVYTCTVCEATKTETLDVLAPLTQEILEHERQNGFIYILENYKPGTTSPKYVGNINDEKLGRQITNRQPIEGTYTVGEPYFQDGEIYIEVTITDLQPYYEAFVEKYDDATYVIDETNSSASYRYTLRYVNYEYPSDTCSWRLVRCEEKSNRLWIVHVHTTEDWTVTKEATCEEDGVRGGKCLHTYYPQRPTSTTYLCKTNFEEVIPATGHAWDDGVVTTEPTCTEAGELTYTCENDPAHTKTEPVEALGHDYVDGVCTRCGEKDPDYVAPAPEGVIRLAGATRYETAYSIANQLKENLGVEKFETVVVAYGQNFPDALTGSYLAAVNEAPILLTESSKDAEVIAYIQENLVAGGKVYILGGTAAVSETFESMAKESGFDVERLKGKNRYETNLAILAESGIDAGVEILIATGTNYADSLSASATGLPMVLVGDSLTDAQKEFLAATGGKFVIIGGTGAVSEAVEAELAEIGSVERIKGKTRYETSVVIAERYFTNPQAAVLAYAENFPDGLCGGALAVSMDAPLILTSNGSSAAADAYVENISAGVVTGGTGRISDDTAREIFDLAADAEIVKK